MLPVFLKKESNSIQYKLLTVLVAVVGILPEYIAPVLTVAFFVLFYMNCLHNEKKLTFTKINKAVWAYGLLLLVSFVWSSHVLISFVSGSVFIIMSLVVIFITYYGDTKEKIENIILCLVGSAAINAVISILQMSFMAVGKVRLFPNPFYEPLDELVYGILPVDVDYIGTADRVASTFNNPLMLATFFVMAFPLAAFCCFYASTKKRRIFSVITCLLIFFGIMFTFLRGSVIAITFAFMILAFTGKKPAKVMSLVAIATAIILPIVIFSRRGLSSAQDISTSNLFSIWHVCFGSIVENPILGLGAGVKSVSELLFANGIQYPNAHNLFFEILTELGVVGFVLFAVMILTVIVEIMQLFKCGGWWKRYSVAMLSSLGGLFAMSMFDYTLHTPKELFYFFVIIGCVEASARYARKHKEAYDVKI